MKITRILLIIVILYVGYKYVYPKLMDAQAGGGSGGRRGGKKPAGRQVAGAT